MYKHVLSSIPGIELYPIVALILFFGFFAALIVWFFRADTARLKDLSARILEDGIAPDHQSQPTIPSQRS